MVAGQSISDLPDDELPTWIPPQLSQLVKQAPGGSDWVHEIKYDGYRMHARLDRGQVRLLTRTGLDWTDKYPAIASALAQLPATSAYLDGELCGVRPDGVTSFSMIQSATDSGTTAGLVFFAFDLLYLNGTPIAPLPLITRKVRLRHLLEHADPSLHYSDHQEGSGPEFHAQACRLGLEGIVSKRADAAYAPGNRGLRVKAKCLNREEFVVVGWTDPEGSRPYLGSLLLGYYTESDELIYAGRAGTGMRAAELKRVHERLWPLAIDTMPLDRAPPRDSRVGSRSSFHACIGCAPSWWLR